MASYPQNFRFGEFVGSLIWLIFWILVIVALVVLPLIFIILFYVPLPEIDGKVLTPYLFLTSILYTQSAFPVIKTLLASTLFKVAVFAILGFFPLIALLFSWASNSKYPFIGGLRALHQLIAFEIPFLISALSVVLLSGTLNLTEVVESQIQSYWFIFFLPISAFVFYISSLAELERIPFDLPEAEAEIVAGWLTETSGMIYGLLQLGSYIKTYALAAWFVILFLGGWAGPQIFPTEIMPGSADAIIPIGTLYSANAVNAVFWFTLKTFGVIMLMLLPRGISPRIRIDILLHTGWYKLIVLAFINMFIALALIYGGVLGPSGLLVR